MSHVDEGTLHALLDGALAAAEPAEAERVELHLAACADCRARLEEAARVRDEAAALLGSAQPREYVLPSFDAIRGRATLPGPMLTDRPRSFLRSPFSDFAWAAMVVLALGLGWMLNDTLEDDEVASRGVSEVALSERMRQPDIRMYDLTAPGPDSAPVARAAPEVEDVAEFRGPRPGQLPRPIDEITVEGARVDGGVGERVAAEAAEAPVELDRLAAARADADAATRAEEAAALARAEEAAALARTDEAVVQRTEQAAGAERRALAAPPAAAPPPAPVPLGELAAGVASQGAGAPSRAAAADWRAVTITEAERLTNGRVVRIAGARILASAVRGSGTDLELQTVQLTDRGESIEVVQRRTPQLDARSRDDLVAGESEAPLVTAGLTVRLDEWTVTISGAVAPERLRELARGLT